MNAIGISQPTVKLEPISVGGLSGFVAFVSHTSVAYSDQAGENENEARAEALRRAASALRTEANRCIELAAKLDGDARSSFPQARDV